MTQEFHISVTPIGQNEFLVRTEKRPDGAPLAEEQVTWPVEDWLAQASILMNDPLLGLLRGDPLPSLPQGALNPVEPSAASLVAFGQELYNSLFQGTLRDSWMTAKGIAQHRREILRLRLGLKDERLPRLPWEVLHAGNRPIATGVDVAFSRYHSGFRTGTAFPQPFVDLDPGQPLRILMVLAAPTDQEVLALKQEAENLKQELQHTPRLRGQSGPFSEIELTILDQPDREQLTQALEHNHYQVFHYAGHSNLGAAGGSLYLVSTKTGLTETLSGDDLAGLLVNNGIRMAVFNSCRGVYTATSQAGGEGNLAEALVKRGIPAVLAMAERIPDSVALTLSRLFYRNLKQAYPIDLSLNRARQGLISAYSSDQLYWALPILYLHPQFDGYLRRPTAATADDRAPDITLDEVILAAESESVLTGAPSAELERVSRPDDEYPFAADFDPFVLDDDPELGDLTYELDEDGVARLVRELSQDSRSALAADLDPLLDNAEDESLLPETGYPAAFQYPNLPEQPPRYSTPARVNRVGLPAPAVPTEEVYSELEQMLMEAGKLTEAIAARLWAVRLHPTQAEAHDQLGWALYQNGYVAESVTAFQYALQLNPSLAAADNHLGMALTQQGQWDKAIQAFERAIQNQPDLNDAYQNLDWVLRQRGESAVPPAVLPQVQTRSVAASQAIVANPAATATLQPSPTVTQTDDRIAAPNRRPGQHRARRIGSSNSLLWIGVGALSVPLLLAGWLAYRQLQQPAPSNPLPAMTAPQSPQNPKQGSPEALAARATELLNQGNIAAAQPLVEELLERNDLTRVEAILTPALTKQPDQVTLNALMGRLAWQSIKVGNQDYNLYDARRYWERATKGESTPTYQNALGFVYYEEGNEKQANQAWSRTLEQLGQTAASEDDRSSKVALNAYAGIAIALMKSADNELPSRRGSLLSEAVRLRQKILTDDSVNFQPEALAKDWMWSEKAIGDWEKLLKLKLDSGKE